MTDSDKPFVCNASGCGQRFTNHDHLSAHQQKHDLSLRFRQGETLLVDQTPTPTRFLRIGEKIGLFQELEEATSNPFDQDFKTATNSKVGKPCGLEQSRDESSGQSSEDNGIRVIPTTIPVAPPANLVNPDNPVAMATAPAHVNTASALTKQKLLQTIQMKEQQKLLEQTIARQLGQPPEFLAQALKKMIPISEGCSTFSSGEATFLEPTEVPARRRRGRKPDEEEPEMKRQRFLERNRAAASRCRAKKKVWMDNLEVKCNSLESDKHDLNQEVVALRSEVQQLKSILVAHKDCPLIVHQSQVSQSHHSGELNGPGQLGGVTLLSQLASIPSMSPLISSPVPSVGSVVPNMQHNSSNVPLMLNGLTQQQAPEVAKDVEISDEVDGPPLPEQ